jgi:hypothetical protein
MSRTGPPGGAPPPQTFEFPDGTQVDLAPLARRLSALYYDVYPDDLERYGSVGLAWCDHDSRYLIAWALEDARANAIDCVAQVQWLARVLAARGFPVDRLGRHVELTAALLRSSELGDIGDRAAERLSHAASVVTDSERPVGPGS